MGNTGDELLRADPRVRKRAILIALLMTLVGFASLALFHGFLREMEALATASPQLAWEKLHLVGTAALMVALFSSTAFACVLAYVAFRVFRAGQWPPPGFRVAWDMPIRTGRQATVVAVCMVVLAGVALACGAILLNLPAPELEEQRERPRQAV